MRFVTINTFITVFDEITWDIHGSKPFTSIAGMKDIVAPMYDQGYSALIEDLFQRGMLDNTLVCNLAEFGRTPKINPAGGRDHWPQCWTVYFAGGGVKGGRVVGKSDEIGGYPVERPVKPAEVVATIYHSLGLDLETHLPGPQSRPFPAGGFRHATDPGVVLSRPVNHAEDRQRSGLTLGARSSCAAPCRLRSALVHAVVLRVIVTPQRLHRHLPDKFKLTGQAARQQLVVEQIPRQPIRRSDHQRRRLSLPATLMS